ncbi:MAG: glycosyltransferase [Oscillospiraceae bacterium]
MNILILTGKFGLGHFSAATSIMEKIKAEDAKTNVAIVDIFDYGMPKTAPLIYKSFENLVNYGSVIYNSLYKMTENNSPSFTPLLMKLFMPKIDKLFQNFQPNIIVSTLPFCSQLVSKYKEEFAVETPLLTAITDVSVHPEWVNSNTDCYLVASKSVKNGIVLKGVPEEKIFVTGIPVKEEFSPLPRLVKFRKNLLIMGGGLGLLPKNKEFYERLNRMENVKVTIITGKNFKLYKKLVGKYNNIDVLGFTGEVYKYMQKADAILSKPGGVTLFETIASELPIITLNPFLQQEIHNANFISEHNIGVVLPKNGYIDKIELVLNDDEKLSEMRANMKAMKGEIDDEFFLKVLSKRKLAS